MKVKYHILNELTLRQYGHTDNKNRAKKWLDKHLAKNTFGKGERNIEYRKDLISNGNPTVLFNSFESVLMDRVLSESVRFTDLMGRPTEENTEEIQYKIYIRRVKSDLVITETDVTSEEEEKEEKEKQKKVKKRVAERKLAKILDEGKFDFSKPKHVQRAFKRILNYLEVDIEGDEDETEE